MQGDLAQASALRVRGARALIALATALALAGCAGGPGEQASGQDAGANCDARSVRSVPAPEGALEFALPGDSPSEVGGAQITVRTLSCDGGTLTATIDIESPDGTGQASLGTGEIAELPGGGQLMLLGLDGEGDASFALITG